MRWWLVSSWKELVVPGVMALSESLLRVFCSHTKQQQVWCTNNGVCNTAALPSALIATETVLTHGQSQTGACTIV